MRRAVHFALVEHCEKCFLSLVCQPEKTALEARRKGQVGVNCTETGYEQLPSLIYEFSLSDNNGRMYSKKK
jgi:hypothetical protein